MKKLLFILLACLPLFGMAKDKKDNSNPKYLAGAITMEDGKVTFNHEIKAPSLSKEQLYQQMLDSSLDVAVLRGEYPWDGTQFLLSQENICLICSEENKDRPISDYLYIDHSSDATISAQMARWRYENGVTNDTGNFVVDNIMVCREMVERGLGWALMPEVALDGFKGSVKPCTFENGEPFVRRTYIFCQRDAAALPQVQLFMDMLKKHR